jgi:hypothetical protein
VTTDQVQIRKGLFLEVLASFGEARLAVTGLSMLPAVWPGDILTVRRKRIEEIAPGDVVLYSRNGQFTVHRVVEVRGTGYGIRDTGYATQDTGYGVRGTGNWKIGNRKSKLENRQPGAESGATLDKQDRIPYPVSRVPYPDACPLLITQGDRLRYWDPPVAPEELLGRVTAIERGRRHLNPRLTLRRRVGAWVLRRSDFCARAVLHLRNRFKIQDLRFKTRVEKFRS